MREPTYYSYTASEQNDLRRRPLQPDEVFWVEQETGSLALPLCGAVCNAADPKGTLLTFLESADQDGAGASGWDAADLASSWCPDPAELSDLLEA